MLTCLILQLPELILLIGPGGSGKTEAVKLL